MSNNQNIVYVAEVKNDIDDLVTIEYLEKTGRLKGIVLDPEEGLDIVQKYFPNVKVFKTLEEADCDIIFCGGATTKIAKHLETHEIQFLVMNGGFVQAPIDLECLDKFKGKDSMRTFNFNLDVVSTDKMLKSKNLKMGMFVGKNVCHSIKNTKLGIHKGLETIFDVKDEKRLHDLLMAQEGLRLLDKKPLLCSYIVGMPKHTGLNGTYTKWYTEQLGQGKFIIAVEINENKNLG